MLKISYNCVTSISQFMIFLKVTVVALLIIFLSIAIVVLIPRKDTDARIAALNK